MAIIEKDFDVITPWRIGGREHLLFYNSRTGSKTIMNLDDDGQMNRWDSGAAAIPVYSTGWSHILYCNRVLLFYNDQTGSAVVTPPGLYPADPFNGRVLPLFRTAINRLRLRSSGKNYFRAALRCSQ